jgi:hypothetical protein
MKTIYIASPYTKGDPQENTDKSFDCALDLIEAGFAPYAPLYTHYLHLRRPQKYETWTGLDLVWVLKCDALLRLPGESSGADGEVAFAKANNIPVFYSVQKLIEWFDFMGGK